MKLSDLIGTELTVIEASPYRILLEMWMGGAPSNQFFLIEAELTQGGQDAGLVVKELKATEMK